MITVNIIGFSLIAFIIWWFWLYTPKSKRDSAVPGDTLFVHVANGTYKPSTLVIPEGQSTDITFRRDDTTPCAGSVIFPELSIQADLPLHKAVSVHVQPLKAGRYQFHCQMSMYTGTIEVTPTH